jgi:hypothetical protein
MNESNVIEGTAEVLESEPKRSWKERFTISPEKRAIIKDVAKDAAVTLTAAVIGSMLIEGAKKGVRGVVRTAKDRWDSDIDSEDPISEESVMEDSE